MTQNADYGDTRCSCSGRYLDHEDDPSCPVHGLPQSADSVRVTGIWLRRNGDLAEVLAEVDGEWLLVISEQLEGHFSHIVEPGGIRRAGADPLTMDAEPVGEALPPNGRSGS